jgi:hypothetical protein
MSNAQHSKTYRKRQKLGLKAATVGIPYHWSIDRFREEIDDAIIDRRRRVELLPPPVIRPAAAAKAMIEAIRKGLARV